MLGGPRYHGGKTDLELAIGSLLLSLRLGVLALLLLLGVGDLGSVKRVVAVALGGLVLLGDVGKLGVNLDKSGADGLLDGLGDGLLHDAGDERSKSRLWQTTWSV